MHLSIVAVGSRGDVQPYLALGRGLQKAGFQVQICADRLFENLVTSTGLVFTPVTVAPAEMMQQNLSRYGGPVKLLGWLERHFNPMVRQFFSDLESATRHTDAILYYLIKPIVNECRRDVLGLNPLPGSFYRRLEISRLPIVYGFSPNLLPRPEDWGEWLRVSGHWFLDDQSEWQPSDELLRFLEAGKPPIYVGFGSMVDEQIEHATRIVLEALQRTGQRGILLGGWGGLGTGDLPGTILCLESIPHDWLFPRLAAVLPTAVLVPQLPGCATEDQPWLCHSSLTSQFGVNVSIVWVAVPVRFPLPG